MKVGRVRYGVLGTDAGRIMDDGTIARLDEDEYYVTTTSTGAGAVLEWFEWWNAVWGMDVEIANVTGALAAVNVAGPHARELLGRLTDLDVGNEAFAYLDAKAAHVAGVPSLILRIGFVGELGYEIHFPSPFGEYLWDTVLERGADLGIRPFGLEPQRILRLEKMHVLVGQDTDSESNPLEASMPWIVKFDKQDFVGKWSLEQVQERGFREQLVGFEMANGVVPPEGGQIVVERPARRPSHQRALERPARPGDRDGLGTARAGRGRRRHRRQGERLDRARTRAPAALLRPGRGAPPRVSVARLRLAPVGETMFPPRTPFFDPVEEPPGSPTPPPHAHGPRIGL